MTRKIHSLALLLAAAALAAVPVAEAHHRTGHTPGAKSKRCAKPGKRAFVVRGTLTSFTADDPATAGTDETSVTITVLGANRHARRSGELQDQDPGTPGTQVKGGTYSVNAASDPGGFKTQLSGYESGESPKAGDKVRILGKIAYTQKKCAPEGTSVEDRYGDVNVRRVKIIDVDPQP